MATKTICDRCKIDALDGVRISISDLFSISNTVKYPPMDLCGDCFRWLRTQMQSWDDTFVRIQKRFDSLVTDKKFKE